MAITSAGYAGTVNDLQWAKMSRYFGMDYAAKTAADIACTQNGAAKTFNIAAGEFYGRGIMDTNSSIVNLAPTVPAAGQWFLLVARRTWATKVTTFVVVPSSTTTTAVPTVVPVALPTINTNPGVTDDQPLYWAWINSANTTTLVVDIRRTADARGDLRAAGSDLQRSAIFPAPSVGDRIKRTDLGYLQEWNGTAWVTLLTTATLGADGNGSTATNILTRDAYRGVDLSAVTNRTNGTTYASALIMGVLPVGFRPVQDLVVQVLTYGSGSLNNAIVGSNGLITLMTGSPAGHTGARITARFTAAP
jgi:hypothetical protein